MAARGKSATKVSKSAFPSAFTTHSLPTRALLPSAGHTGALAVQPGTSPSMVQDEQPQKQREKKHMHWSRGIFHR